MADLSAKQQAIIEFIERYIEEHDQSPTVREIQSGVAPILGQAISSTSVVDYNLDQLQTKGKIIRNKSQSRGIKLVGPRRSSRSIAIPMYGQIAAGQPIESIGAGLAVEELDTFDVPPTFLPPRSKNVYAMTVKGHSMIDALIDDGDIVLVERQETAEPGQIVAVWLEQEQTTTLKKWYPEPSQNRVRLQPANSTMQPIFTPLANAKVMGRLVGVIRQYI